VEDPWQSVVPVAGSLLNDLAAEVYSKYSESFEVVAYKPNQGESFAAEVHSDPKSSAEGADRNPFQGFVSGQKRAVMRDDTVEGFAAEEHMSFEMKDSRPMPSFHDRV
jgi:hypothetical protein